MAEYDNTNSGVVFSAFPDQKLVGQGRLNIDGTDHRVVMVMEPFTKGGAPEMVLYQRLGPLFKNDKNDNEKAPDRSGPVDPYPGKRIAAWVKEKDNRKFFSLAISDRQQRNDAEESPLGEGSTDINIDDEIPW